MNQKEVNELRRRFRADRSAISRIYGCYVNTNREVVSYLDTPLGLLSEEETAMYLERMKKVLSGGLGKNLIDIVFTTAQVADSDEHRLLSDLRNTALENREARDELYRKIIETIEPEDSGYLILLAADRYDVPRRGKDGEDRLDESESVFSYIVCAICPVKDGGADLRYFHDVNEFHGSSCGLTVGPPSLGFLFPAFDDRCANIYNALYYARKPDELHQELIDALFRTEVVMSAGEQRQAFHTALSQALDRDCSFEVVQAVHEQLRERIEQHKEEKNPEPLDVSSGEVAAILERSGVPAERVEAFRQACGDQFGENAVLRPENLIESSRFEIKTPEARINVAPEASYLVETRVLDGRTYFLIPVDQDVEVNGMPVSVLQRKEDDSPEDDVPWAEEPEAPQA